MKHVITALLFSTIGLSQTALNIESYPNEAVVKIDGQKIGVTPVYSYQVPVGVHKFEIVKKGYAPVRKEIDVQKALSLQIQFRLNKLYEVVFKTREKELEFALDEKHYWREPKVRFAIEEGQHLLQVFQADSLIDEQKLTIDHSTEILYKLEVEPEKPQEPEEPQKPEQSG
ncbi:MAG: PEGA domain-containing protein [FCB group bacterium]|nr:PEGA domain-containing protein [FCB group bacterium]